MRKVITIICLTVSIMFMLTGCNEGQSISTLRYSDKYNMPDISSLARDADGYNYFYVIDNNTGVVYLQFWGHNQGGITVALNSDGTPVTIDQIKK